ncbi:hypothetical protein [Oceanirhabdus seepicola]|uniref:Uncharacterized protein n=1 Tax=Oceanirhabdus seepicola TaxID=2828781 RepID=A0A9J6NZX0_9CLOT|nr:hypothetical protein [Oceanirhabdus seepicola]MCM1989978.1 hypothetical protein [Oceanirhabdus seepicola]
MNEKRLPKNYKHQEKSIIKQVKKQGIELIDVIYVDFEEEHKNEETLNNTVKSIIGGKLKVTYAQVFILNKHGKKQIYIQPYSGPTPLPGEHHVLLSGGFSSPIVLKDQEMYGGPSWKCEDLALENKVNKEGTSLEKASKQIEFQWSVRTGKIDLEWAVQLYYLGEGKSHLIMQSGYYGGFRTYKVGFKAFGELVESLKGVLENNIQGEQQPLYQSFYKDIVNKFLNK